MKTEYRSFFMWICVVVGVIVIAGLVFERVNEPSLAYASNMTIAPYSAKDLLNVAPIIIGTAIIASLLASGILFVGGDGV